ncbi:MAG: hypothetical protein LBI86_02020 [Treponema sp.]|jgi:hypothetical protein|nr:hypothetical protein [Treponema sp.]
MLKKQVIVSFFCILALSACETFKEGLSSLSNSISSVVGGHSGETSENSDRNILSKEPESEQVAEIKVKWQQYKPKIATKIFVETPSVTKPYHAGILTPDFLTNGLNTLKFVRYLAGLSENIVMTDELNDLGQYGAVILAKNRASIAHAIKTGRYGSSLL